MASDWIKLRVDLHRDPAVLKMSDMCRTNRHQIVGQLSDVWGWIDGHTVDGMCPNISAEMIDAYVGASGFAAAMIAVGWLEACGDGVRFPRWERHNSMTAKARALENEAKRLRREHVGQVSDKMSDKMSIKRPTREEKRREENIMRSTSPLAPQGGNGGTSRQAASKSELDEAWIESLVADPTWKGVDVRHELGKAQTWCSANNRKCTKRFFANWLNRADAPLLANGTNPSHQPPRQHASI